MIREFLFFLFICHGLMAQSLVPSVNRLEMRTGNCALATVPIFKVDPTLATEGYTLDIAPGGITITSSDAAGAYYAQKTLHQLAKDGHYPCLHIEDAPRFRWRGFMLDCSRHFFPKDAIKRMLDLMAERKLNVFHWHLVDGPGWRIEIKSHPELVERGAWRKDMRGKVWDWRATELCSSNDPDAYGGFYTQDDIREIIAYARERHIAVVPEIEMPGHSYAALIAHPEFACNPTTIRTDGLRGKDVFCASNVDARKMLRDVLDEVCDLFPDAPYIHLGGDEVSHDAWDACPKCQAKKQDNQIQSSGGLEADFLHDMAAHLAKKGRKAIFWDEAASYPLPAGAAIMNWRGDVALRKALAQKVPVIATPIKYLYLDYSLSPVLPGSAPSAGPGASLEQILAYDPTAGLSKEEADLIIGVQACLWTEHVQTEARAHSLILPRLNALAEIAWKK